jgi:hypothetical protein
LARKKRDIVSQGTGRIFICYSSKDEATAREIVDSLEANGLNCWISSRDVQSGENYQEAIVAALEKAKGIVFLFSESSSASGEIKKELSIAGGLNMPVFPLRLTTVMPRGALRYELATRQWIDIFPDRERALGKLVATIRRALEDGPRAEDDDANAPPPPTQRAPAREPLVAPGSRQFEAIRALLARHIGPIAKVIVQKAATEARTPDDLCERLAAHVTAPSERASFLQAARAQLAGE